MYYLEGKYDGMAPNAKISFSDYGTTGGLCISPESQLYGNGYATGARISSNSWGSVIAGISYYSGSSTDAYLFRTPVIRHDHKLLLILLIHGITIINRLWQFSLPLVTVVQTEIFLR